MKSSTIRPYTGPGFILTAAAAHEVGEPHLRMSASPKASVSVAPAKRAKAPIISATAIYAARAEAERIAAEGIKS